MDLMDLLKASGGESGLGQLAQTVGLDSSDTSNLIKALAPALMRGVQKNAASDAGAGLSKALQTGGHERYIDNPELLAAEETRQDGNNILGHIFGSKDVSRNVAAVASEVTRKEAGLWASEIPMHTTLKISTNNETTSRRDNICT